MIWSILDSAFLVIAVLAIGVGIWRPTPARIVSMVLLATAISLIASAGCAIESSDRNPILLPLATASLLALVFIVVWRLHSRYALAAALPIGAAQAAIILQEAGPDDAMSHSLAGIALWWLVGIGVAGAALYLRLLDQRRERALAETRRSQRLELARDLHDFVAHDVSAIVVQAQAAQVAADREPGLALDTLRWIEEAGLRALDAMDQTIHALRDIDGPLSGPDSHHVGSAQTRRFGLEDLHDLVEQFAAAGSANVHLAIEPGALDALPPEVTTTGYRVVVEALTNIRRHAPGATRVYIDIERVETPVGPGINVSVTNDSNTAGGSPGRTFGLGDRDSRIGLIGLRERIEMLGGNLTAGPTDHAGWHVTAVMPLPGARTATVSGRTP